jgi:hypothetical protein
MEMGIVVLFILVMLAAIAAAFTVDFIKVNAAQ